MLNTATPGQFADGKRHAWLLSVLVPVLIGSGPLVALLTGDQGWLWAPIVFVYLVGPLLDTLLGEDQSNPQESEVPRLEADSYYRLIPLALVPVIWVMVAFSAWYFCSAPLSWAQGLAVIMSTGLICGLGINVGHELGHKGSRLDRLFAFLALVPSGYAHFGIEHNNGHHRDVATPEDCASARMGESLYRFFWREMPGGYRRAWQLECNRLAKRGLGTWSVHNTILVGAASTFLSWAVLALWLGPLVLPFMLLVSLWGNFQLTIANYVEHYGLLRRKDASGTYERCTPAHSWNSNQLFSNWALFHLQRHADHHAHPGRRYQSLRHFADSPQLPNGYFVMFICSYVPPLWRWVMDKRLARTVKGDPSAVNFDPASRAQLIGRYFSG